MERSGGHNGSIDVSCKVTDSHAYHKTNQVMLCIISTGVLHNVHVAFLISFGLLWCMTICIILCTELILHDILMTEISKRKLPFARS